jgi:hypothetical protein
MSDIKTSHAYCRYTFCVVMKQGRTDTPLFWEKTIYANAQKSLDRRAERILLDRARTHPGMQIDADYYAWDRVARKWRYLRSSSEIMISKQLASIQTGETA